MNSVKRFIAVNKYLVVVALFKATVAGAGLALAFLASIDLAIAVFAQEAWQSWQVDQWVNRFAATGAVVGIVWHIVKAVFIR